jgi:hypothetical protein
MVKKALLIGINYYSVPNARLNGCINDVLKIKDVLITQYGYLEQNIIILSDNQTAQAKIPTAKNIVIQIQNLVQSSSSTEEIFFHYSGHGSQIQDKNGDEKTGKDSIIIPVDFQKVGIITDDLLYQLFRQIKCPIFMIYDSCFSGTVCDLIYSFQWNRNQPNTFIFSQNNTNVNTNKNIYMISGCRDDQTSADAYFPETKQYGGACTTAFIFALKQNNYTGTIAKIYNDMCAYLNNKYTQLPILSSTTSTPNYMFQPSVAAARFLMNSVFNSGFTKETINGEKEINNKTIKYSKKRLVLTF